MPKHKILASLMILILGGLTPVQAQTQTLAPALTQAQPLTQTLPLSILVSVAGEGDDVLWAKQTCQNIYDSIQFAAGTPTEVGCLWKKKDQFLDPRTREALNSGRYHLFLEFRKESSKNLTLRAVNRDREFEEEYQQVEWRLNSETNLEQHIAKLIQPVIQYHQSKYSVLSHLVAQASEKSKQITLNSKDQFLDRMSMEPISSKTAYLNFVSESPQQKHYIRTAIELIITLGFGQYGYLLSKDTMARDWDYPTLKEAWRSKTDGSGYRFDDNSYFVNRDHAYAGVLYYTIARNNGFSSYESFLINLAASSVWEFIVEYREVVSLNDQVLTPIGGFVIGEALFQIQKIFDKPGNSLVKKSLGYIFQSPRNFHRYVDKFTRPEDKFAAALNEAGFNRDVWSKFELYAGQASSNKSPEDGVQIGMNAQVINIPVYDEPGRRRDILMDTAFSQLVIERSMGNIEPNHFLLMARIAMAAYYQKDLGADQKGNLQGYNFWIGPASRVQFKHSYTTDSRYQDQQAIVNVLGGIMQLTYYQAGFKITANFEVYGDFAMIKSYNLDQYQAEHGDSLLPRVVRANDYYYGMGFTTNGHLIVEYGKWSLEAGSSFFQQSAIKDRHRFGEEGQNMPDMKDTELVLDASVGYKLSKNIAIKFKIERSRRAGYIEGSASKNSTEIRKYIYLNYFF